jgi:uncharacterized protein (TIRG00374 family)
VTATGRSTISTTPDSQLTTAGDGALGGEPASPYRTLMTWKLVIPVVLALAVVFAFGIYARPRALARALAGFDYLYLVPILALAFSNYLVRFVRWQYLLRVVGVRVARRRSLGVFFSGLAMSVTPGKLGELFKCLMLKREVDAAYSKTVPVVLDERLTDLVAIVLLASLGVARYQAGRAIFVVGLVSVVAVVVLLALSTRFAERLAPWLSRRWTGRGAAESANETAGTFALLLRARTFAVAVVIGVVAWSCECVAFWLVFPALHWRGVSLLSATFVYATATLAGAVTLLPGGLGVTEGTMAALLAVLAVPRGVAVAATLIIRACTLWFAVILGVAAYVAHMRWLARRSAVAALPPDSASLLTSASGS